MIVVSPSSANGLMPSPATHPLAIDWTGFNPVPSQFVGVATFDASDASQVRRYLDWEAFVRKWELPIGFPEVLDDAEWGDAARQLLADANELLSRWLSAGTLRAEVKFGVWEASAEGDQVTIHPENSASVAITFPRIPIPAGDLYCLADFIKPVTALQLGESDYMGGFAIRLRGPIDELVQSFITSRDEYRSLLARDLWELYRSAVADYLHYRLRRFIWAYCDDDDLSNEEVLAGLQQGIRIDTGAIECHDPSDETTLLGLLGVKEWLADGEVGEEKHLSPVLSGYFLAHPRSRRLSALTNELPIPA
jgi:5-methyltetrahydrofolate--homocysteine methyltransferase